MSSIQAKWDAAYSQPRGERRPAAVLLQNQFLLPTEGRALDLACGLGANSVLLAKAGLKVEAWDLSPVAIEQLQQQVTTEELAIYPKVHNVIQSPPKLNSFDVIVVSFFLERALCSSLVAALKPGGLLFYQTHCQQKVIQQGPSNPDYLLADNELLALFSDLKVRVYSETSTLGDHQQGLRNQAFLVAEK